tara:strand:- start:20 stop:526 length:507 start_codon:yes stop_codon:yes gene_type:complete
MEGFCSAMKHHHPIVIAAMALEGTLTCVDILNKIQEILPFLLDNPGLPKIFTNDTIWSRQKTNLSSRLQCIRIWINRNEKGPEPSFNKVEGSYTSKTSPSYYLHAHYRIIYHTSAWYKALETKHSEEIARANELPTTIFLMVGSRRIPISKTLYLKKLMNEQKNEFLV